MRLIIPRDTNPDQPEYEFSLGDNETFGRLAGWMGFVGIVTILLGALHALSGIAQLTTGAGMLATGIGVCTILSGAWLWAASRSFKAVVTTEGMDITLLMHALGKLRSVYTMQGIFMILVLLLFGVVVFLATSSRA